MSVFKKIKMVLSVKIANMRHQVDDKTMQFFHVLCHSQKLFIAIQNSPCLFIRIPFTYLILLWNSKQSTLKKRQERKYNKLIKHFNFVACRHHYHHHPLHRLPFVSLFRFILTTNNTCNWVLM